MWEAMQQRGYFKRHPHYREWFDGPEEVDDTNPELEKLLETLGPTTENIFFPGSYSHGLERLVKRTEASWLPRLFTLERGTTALDVGCGFGRSLGWMRSHFEHLIGVDISERAIELAREHLGDSESVELLVGDGDGLPATIPPASVDFIYCFNVFEHIPRDFTRAYLRDFARVLAPTGRAVFNLLSGTRHWAISGRLHSEWSIGYSRRAAARMVLDAGLEIRRQLSWRVESARARWLWIEARRSDHRNA